MSSSDLSSSLILIRRSTELASRPPLLLQLCVTRKEALRLRQKAGSLLRVGKVVGGGERVGTGEDLGLSGSVGFSCTG